MANQPIELHPETINRRDVNKALAALGLLGLGGGVVTVAKYMSGGGGELPPQPQEQDAQVLAMADVKDIVDQAGIPKNMHENSPENDPTVYIGMRPEEITKRPRMAVTSETKTHGGFSKATVNDLNTLVNFGWSEENLNDAIAKEYVFGLSPDEGEYGEYIDENFASHWVKGQFPEEYADEEGNIVSKNFKDYILGFSDNFADVITDGKWRGGRGTAPKFTLVGSTPLTVEGYSRCQSIDVLLTVPSTVGLDMTYDIEGNLVVYSKEGADKKFESALFSYDFHLPR